MSNIDQFLKKIGVPADTIAKLTGDDTDVNIDDLSIGFRSVQRDVLKNDPDFIQPIKDEIRGSELSKIEHRIRKTFGLTSDQVKDKKFDEIITIAHEHSSKSSNAGADELQQKLIELSTENKRLVDEVIPAKENESKNAIKTFKRESIIQSMIAKRSLIVSNDVVIPAVKSFIDSNYNIDVDDAGQLVVKTKNNLNPLNGDGTKIVTFDEILDGHLATLGVVKQSNGNQNQNQPRTPQGGNQGNPEPAKFNLVGLKAAEQNAESLKAMKVFGNGTK